ncbi:ATP-binding cassette domain-containing protein [Streptomyces sp. NBC_00847]|nr:ATP-binding cassette domain-containing protein [Streptomyces sp. NBC_00847]
MHRSCGRHPVRRGADLTVTPGHLVAVVGENGAGKSTLLKILAGTPPVDRGEVVLSGICRALSGIRHRSDRCRARWDVGWDPDPVAIDVMVRRMIPLPPEQVAAYAMDWRHDTWGHLPCPFRAMGEDSGHPPGGADQGSGRRRVRSGCRGDPYGVLPRPAHRLRPAGGRPRAAEAAGHDRHGRPHAHARHVHLRGPPSRHPGRHPGARRPGRPPSPGGTADVPPGPLQPRQGPA